MRNNSFDAKQIRQIKQLKQQGIDAVKIAHRSSCSYKVAAFGFDKRGNLLGYAYNKSRFVKFGGGIHAEINLLRKLNGKLRDLCSVMVVRSTKGGKMTTMDVCESCARVLSKLGVKVIS